MDKKLRLIGLTVLVFLATILVISPAWAGVTRTDFTATDQPISYFTGGRTWIEDGYLNMRELEYSALITQLTPDQNLDISGIFAVSFNANIDLSTLCGPMWGKATNVGWEGSFQGKICFDQSLNPVSFSTKGVFQGINDLKGLQMRYSNTDGYMTGYVLEVPDS